MISSRVERQTKLEETHDCEPSDNSGPIDERTDLSLTSREAVHKVGVDRDGTDENTESADRES